MGFPRGKGSGKAQGQWVFVPAGRSLNSVVSQPRHTTVGKGFGKGKSGKSGKSGKDAQRKMFLDKLGQIDAANKVWIGSLPDGTTWKDVLTHFEESGCKPTIAEMLGRNTACAAYKTSEEAETAIATVNGTDLGGATIEVDVWTQKEKPAFASKVPVKKVLPKPQATAAKPAVGKPVVKGTVKTVVKQQLKTKAAAAPVAGNVAAKLRATDASLKVWVGGMKKTTTAKSLKQHFDDHGLLPDQLNIMKPGTACLSFESADIVETVIATLNGSELDGETLQVDAWTSK